MIKQASRQSSMASNKGNDMHIHEILESVVAENIPGQQAKAPLRETRLAQ